MTRVRLTELKRVDEVPAVIREKFILTGYRPVGLSVADMIRSCTTWMSNETLNVWTHLIPAIYFFMRTWDFYREMMNSDDAMLHLLLVIVAFSIGSVLLTSSVAHCFNCWSPRGRHTCFYCDYGAIGFYSVCTGMAHYYYSGPLPSDDPTPTGQWLIGTGIFRPAVFVPLQFATHTVALVLSAMTRHHWRSVCYLVRTVNYVLAFFINIMPMVARYCVSTNSIFRTTSLDFYIWQALWNVAAAIANVSKVPERLYPGKFDTVGHSHQWMHVFVTLSIASELNGIQLDLQLRQDEYTYKLDPLWVLGLLISFTVISILLILYFRGRLQKNGNLKATGEHTKSS